MKVVKNSLATMLAMVVGTFTYADVTVTKEDGGSVVTVLSGNIAVNKDSTMRSEWVAIHDDELPVDLVVTPGVATDYKSGRIFTANTDEVVNAARASPKHHAQIPIRGESVAQPDGGLRHGCAIQSASRLG